MRNLEKKYDVFISHASEDKDSFVRALAVELERYSIRVWYDEFTMKLGDGLSRSIDTGLQSCRYGVIVLSKHFLEKNWPDVWERVKMEVVLKNAVVEAESAVVPMSQILQQTTRQSVLTRQQIIRAKAIYYGIGRHIGKSFPDYIFTYELDLVPEREIQSWEIMNACYLEIIDSYPSLSEREIKELFKALLLLSLGTIDWASISLSYELKGAIVRSWQENYYEF